MVNNATSIVVEASLFNAFTKGYNDELNFTIKQLSNTIEAAEKIFHSEHFDELEDLDEEAVATKYMEWLPEYIAGIAKEVRIMNAENMSDSAEIKALRTLRMRRVATVFSMLYQSAIPLECYVMDNVTLDTYTYLYKNQQQALEQKAVEEAGGVEAIAAKVLGNITSGQGAPEFDGDLEELLREGASDIADAMSESTDSQSSNDNN